MSDKYHANEAFDVECKNKPERLGTKWIINIIKMWRSRRGLKVNIIDRIWWELKRDPQRRRTMKT